MRGLHHPVLHLIVYGNLPVQNGGNGWPGGTLMALGFANDRAPLLEALVPNLRAMVGDGSFLGLDPLTLPASGVSITAGHHRRSSDCTGA